ncbi:hypothetical protein M0D69_25075 [Caballeronia sp. SEWSISQ10-4 2]|uniref:hypothetical protein n=1 Tax=Caballeronia sp. SEWSISQ10-4 2 TaxID=2937438 RepID=UPI002654CBFC|nr:hypothetical protein [Caballeronia sp. SEWSISQ10-4 2]MDN7181208.1 hypothetical protein [Caballeronia sp. SEWSISQ10-4 2]
MERTREKAHLLGLAMVGIPLAALLLLPYATNGLWFDDAINSQTWGMLNRFDVSLWDFSLRVINVWLIDYGRILLCWPVVYGFFYITRDPGVIRIVDVALVITHIAVVVVLLRQLRLSWRAVGLFILFVLSLFQIRTGDDPIAAYASFCQLLGIGLTISLIFFGEWYQTGSVKYLAASTVLATLLTLCYELNFVFLPIAFTCIAIAPHKRRALSFLIVTLPFALWIAANLYLKQHTAHPYSGTSFGSLTAVPVAYAKQLVATLPGSFYFLSLEPEFGFKRLASAVMSNATAMLVFLLSFMTYVHLFRQPSQPADPLNLRLLAGAGAFVFFPPALIAISAKYQAELGWGDAHIPVYYQYFGLALVGAVAFERLLFRLTKTQVVLVGLIFSVYVSSNWILNVQTAHRVDNVFQEPRSTFVAAMKDGILGPVRNGDTLEIVDQPTYINGNLIYQTIQKNVFIPREAVVQAWFNSAPRPDAQRFSLYRDVSAGNAWHLKRISIP